MGLTRLALAMAVAVAANARADDWPQWGGELRDGVWRESGIIDRPPEGGPKVLWRVPGPALICWTRPSPRWAAT